MEDVLKIDPVRSTAAGILVRYHRDKLQFGTHIPIKAFLEDPDTDKRTPIQGGIKSCETPLQAMERELAEEYGSDFARQCTVSPILEEPEIGVGAGGMLKLYHWHWIWAEPDAEPVPNPDEVHKFFWNHIESVHKVMLLMSQDKRRMFKNAYDLYAHI